MLDKNKFYNGLYDAIIFGNIKKAIKIAKRIVDQNLPVNEAVESMKKAMNVVDEKYKAKEYFIVDVASSASSMREAFKILEPYLNVEHSNIKGKIVIGSLKGNIQGLGKDIVAATLRASGIKVIDIGEDVSPIMFVETAFKEKAQIIGISISVEETIPYLKDLVNLLKQRKLNKNIKTIIGGPAVSEKTSAEYEINEYAKDAWDCLKKVRILLDS